MDLATGQTIYTIIAPSIYSYSVKRAFQIIEGKYLHTNNDTVVIAVELDFAPIDSTLLTIDRTLIFTNIKDAIDHAYTAYTNTKKNELDTRPETSPKGYSGVVEPEEQNR